MSKPVYNVETKVWSGPEVPPIYSPDQNLGQLIVKVLEQTPSEVTQISADTGVSVTCGKMRNRILKIAAHLSGLGLKQGDVIGVVAANTENLAPLVFACFLMGYPVNPLAPIMVESDIVQMYSKTRPIIIFCDSNNVETVQAAVTEMKSGAEIFTITEKVDGYRCVTEILESTADLFNFTYPQIDPNSTALILCSSGSTGFPKGIQKSHRNIITEFRPNSDFNPNGNSSIFQFSAIFWFSGSLFMIVGTLFKYSRIITTRAFDPSFLVEIVNKYKVTHTFAPPYGMINLLQLENLKPLPSVRYWMVGGSAVSKDLCEKFKPFIPNGMIAVIYGSTEQGIVTINKSDDKFGSSGVPASNTCMKVSILNLNHEIES
jgi:4-coumarate--CoA ligase